MLTVKIHRYKHDKSNDGLSLKRETILSANKTETDYYENEDGEIIHFLYIYNKDNTINSVELKAGVVVYIENLYKKTVQVYGNNK